MRLLIDANISWRAVKLLQEHFDVLHVERTDLPIPATDIQIWEWAKTQNAIIVTNDDDYSKLLLAHGFPPKVVFLKMGNLSTNSIVNVLIKNKPHIQSLFTDNVHGILELL